MSLLAPYPASIGVCTADADGGLARVVGNNTFVGNQTVNGNVAATFFFGDGSGLVNLNPAYFAAGTAGINITGNAATATNASFATNAGSANTAGAAANSAALGGFAASNYARLDIANNFTGSQNVTGDLATTGSVVIGTNGAPILQHLSLTFNPSFPALKPATCATANFTLAGATDGDTLALGVPNARTTGGGTIIYSAWVSAANTVTIQACNISASPQKTAGSSAIRVDDWKH